MKNKKRISFTAVAVIAGLSAGIGYQVSQYQGNTVGKLISISTEETTKSEVNAVQMSSVDGIDLSNTMVTAVNVSQIVEEAMPSVVAVNCVTYVTNQTPYFYGFGTGRSNSSNTTAQQSCGTGIIIGENEEYLLILTNNHVIEDADKVSVTFVDDSEIEGQVLGADADADIAVIQIPLANISADTRTAIKIALLGDSDSVRVGEAAIAIGNALGYGQSVTTGVISAANRDVALKDKTMTLLQTDAAINGGNSGGPLLNANGEVIGINTIKFASTGVEGMGYAIPITIAKPIIEDILAGKYSSENAVTDNPYLGIYGLDVPEQYKSMYGMPGGVFIYQVEEGSPAEQYGLKAGSVITAADGQNISSMEQLAEIIAGHRAGETITLTVQIPDQERNQYVESTITIVLGAVEV